LTAVQQFCRVGAHAMVGGMTGVHKDLIPYGLATGNRAALEGLNLVGLRRRGFSREVMVELKEVLADIFFATQDDISSRVEAAANKFKGTEAKHLIDFILADGERGFIAPEVRG
ncbi:MAG: acyl-[acyl-carrier-protein]--UDP-N-acetylglucosamine O-acyltransferase, partial [Alphaproteobacteria bacterium]|nr:acyl-[acyl-carrier-protein]--UDP-N-acetylglucosamine O-acyltransferase [Alphaproteobacteria bacterium]